MTKVANLYDMTHPNEALKPYLRVTPQPDR